MRYTSKRPEQLLVKTPDGIIIVESMDTETNHPVIRAATLAELELKAAAKGIDVTEIRKIVEEKNKMAIKPFLPVEEKTR